MEVKREPVPADFRVRQLRARDMLRGDLEDEDLERYVEERVMTTTVDKAVGWAQGNSIYPLTFGLACCAIEQIHIVAARVDIARFGFEAFRALERSAIGKHARRIHWNLAVFVAPRSHRIIIFQAKA